jgi:hypothetical protein
MALLVSGRKNLEHNCVSQLKPTSQAEVLTFDVKLN